jgi:hypothetical protein
VLGSGTSATARHGRAPSWALSVLALVGTALVVEGAFIMVFVARGS